jgi:hypothetical protein
VGLALEPRHACWIAGEGFRENFERHVALQLRVTSAIDLAHAPDAEQGLNFVGAKPGSYWGRHKE